MKYSIILGCDHAGLALKNKIISSVRSSNDIVDQTCVDKIEDVGCYSLPRSGSNCDYPDFAHMLCKNLSDGLFTVGILVCGTGQGMAMTANKYPHVRAAVCWNTEIAQLAREHNNANVLCLPARFVNTKEAIEITKVFLNTPFSNEDRHKRRISGILLSPRTLIL